MDENVLGSSANYDIDANPEKLIMSSVHTKQFSESLQNYFNAVNNISTEEETLIILELQLNSYIPSLSISSGELRSTVDKNIEAFSNFSDCDLYFNLYKNGFIDADGQWIFDTESGLPNLGMIYDQSLYSHIQYGGGSLASDGCGFFALLTSITCKTGHIFTEKEIVELAAIANEPVNPATDTNTTRMEKLANHLAPIYGFTFVKGPYQDVVPMLNDGNVSVITLTRNSQHFVSINGMTEDGNYIINETNGDLYDSNPDFRRRVDEDGFTYEEVQFSYGGNGEDVWFLDFN